MIFNSTQSEIMQDDAVPAPQTRVARAYDEPLNILLVEDNPGDELLTRKAVDATHLAHTLCTLKKGAEVLPYLWRSRKQGVRQMPDMLMLDLGLPGIDGFDVLAELDRAPAMIRAVPIIILTGYREFKYVCRNYDLCFLAYLAKPCDPVIMAEMLGTLRYNGSFL